MARTDTRNRIGIIGSNKYEDKKKIKDLIYKLKSEFGDNMVIVSGGRTIGADTYVKKYALEFGCEFKEFNPAHTPATLYSALRESYYGKPYSPRHFFHRNSLMLKYIDYLFIFINDNDNKNQDINAVINEATKANKKFIIVD